VGLFSKNNFRPKKNTSIVVRACELAALGAGLFARGIEGQLIALRQSVWEFQICGSKAHYFYAL
jgi:hypothetical protein